MSTETDIAWCAGFFDGEGHISYKEKINPKTKHVTGTLYCCIPQKSDNREVLDFFQSTIGFGTMYGPYTNKTNGKECERYEIQFKTDEILKLFTLLKPYLKSKKTQDFQKALGSYWIR
jgi:hypothetical protein